MKTENQINSEQEVNDNPIKVFANFILDISQYLNKKEKILLREVSKAYNLDILPHIPLNAKLSTNEEELQQNKNIDFNQIAKFYKNVEKLTLDKLSINEENILGIKSLMENNKDRINVLNLSNLECGGHTLIVEKVFNAINKIETLTDITLGGVGNDDQLISLLQENDINFVFADKITKLKIDNLKLNQIVFILDRFRYIKELTIENCSLDEDLLLITKVILSNNPRLTSLNLSFNGLSSPQALESLKSILKSQRQIRKLVLRGLWFYNISQLEEEFNHLASLETVEFLASKYILNNICSLNIFRGDRLINLKSINLGDSRMESNHLDKLLANIKTNKLEELNFFRCLLNNEVIEVLFKYVEKLQNLKVLNLSFNSKISSNGFNKLIDGIEQFKSLKHLDMRNTGVFIKYSQASLVNYITKRENKCLELIDLCLNSINDNEYLNLVKNLCKKLQELKEFTNLKIYFKLHGIKNVEIQKKIESDLDYLYRNFNLLIR
jgi:hypothetical protein